MNGLFLFLPEILPMIAFEQFELPNGLKVLVHEDHDTEIAVMNLLYDVGSREEDPSKTGFAHLFEHLMFGGSVHIPSFDEPLQRVGGENNAFTSPDITNYYLTVPAQNLETGFWLESDRMLGLSFDPKVLEVQRKVVIEEFKQRYLDQPYGDVWLKLRPMAYTTHPYRWATIGKEISHIEDATMDDVRSFFFTHYRPNRATLVVAGKVQVAEVKRLAEKWFGSIPAGPEYHRNLPQEPEQTERRFMEVEADVPANMLYMAFHMPGRFHPDYHAADLLSDVLGRSQSSRLHVQLVKQEQIFNSIGAYVMGSLDPGLLVIHGRLSDGVSFEEAEASVWKVVNGFLAEGLSQGELTKVKNQAESTLVFSEVEVLNRAMNLAFASLSGDPNLVNKEPELIQAVTVADIMRMGEALLRPSKASVMYYRSNSKSV
jgi:zinc protease